MMNDKYGVSCGCTIETVPMDEKRVAHKLTIIHCPLHANAEKMRDALIELRRGIYDFASAPLEAKNFVYNTVNDALKDLNDD